MSLPATGAAQVQVRDLKVGGLLAEGGEGQVYQLPRQPHLVLKSYRRPADRSHLEDLVAWPDRLDRAAADAVRPASAWPCSVVAAEDGRAEGLLMPRAPRRFAVRHRDGHSRLASLSYLTADPAHRAVAYGLRLPAPVGAERVGLVHALARLLAAFESGEPSVGHGDLSTKNVLWSLQRGPEVFVLDCDNCDLFGPDGRPVEEAGRRRAMTPNWDDPAVPRGSNPISGTDRYSLGLIFLRVVGAANFPIQARQRSGGPVEVRFPVPSGPACDVLLDPDEAVWRLCRSALSLARPEDRPAASEWLLPLERLVAALGGQVATGAVAGGGLARPTLPRSSGDVVIVPERAARGERTWTRVGPTPRYGAAPVAVPIGYRQGPASASGPAGPTGAPAPSIRAELALQVGRFRRWWGSNHQPRPPA